MVLGVKIKVLCVFSCLSFSLFSQIDGAVLFNDNVLHEIRFELMDTNFYASTEDYQRVNMFVDGVLVDSVGVKRKGNISAYYDPDKFGVKVKTNKFVSGKEYDGIKEFSLHINYQDPTMMREKLTYDLCRELGLYSLRTAFAKVYMNDVYRGLYTLVEGKDELFKQQFQHRQMDAIESLDFGNMCFISNNSSDYDYTSNGGNPTYELANGNAATAWNRFSIMIDKANNTSADQYMTIVPEYLNVRDFFRYQALNVYLMNFDSYIDFKGNQIYMYDTVQQLWQVLPWDFNASFGLWNTNNYNPETYEMLPNEVVNGCVAEKMASVPELKVYYLEAMCELKTILSDTTTYFARIDQLKNQIQQAVYDDSRKHFSNSDFEEGTQYGYHTLFGENQPALKTFIAARNEHMIEGLINESFDCGNLAVNELLTIESIGIYPNPATDEINFYDPEASLKGYSILIMNANGEIELELNEMNANVSVKNLSAGVYFVHFIGNTAPIVKRFIKL